MRYKKMKIIRKDLGLIQSSAYGVVAITTTDSGFKFYPLFMD